MCWPPRIVHPNGAYFHYFTKTRQTQVNNEKSHFQWRHKLFESKASTPLPPSLTSTKQTICFPSLEVAPRISASRTSHLGISHLGIFRAKLHPQHCLIALANPAKKKRTDFFMFYYLLQKYKKKTSGSFHWNLVGLEALCIHSLLTSWSPGTPSTVLSRNRTMINLVQPLHLVPLVDVLQLG